MERNYGVIIIGAGIAGLACGKYLIENHLDDFLILEANDQIGGRCQTIHFREFALLSQICERKKKNKFSISPDEQPIELGGEILHGNPSTNALYNLAAQSHLTERLDPSDRDGCYHDESGQSIDEDTINEIEQIYQEILEKKIPTYPYENYPDISLGELIGTEMNEYLRMNKSSLDDEELNQREIVIDWFTKQHQCLSMIGCEKLSDVSVQGERERNASSKLIYWIF